MKYILFVLFFLPLLSQAQQTGTLSGKITDSEEHVLVGVTVRLMQDSTLVKGITTDANGTFELRAIPYGSYHLFVTSVGYHSYTTQVMIFNQQHNNA